MNEEKYCPIAKQDCKKERCVFWVHDACLVRAYLMTNIISLYSPEDEMSQVKSNDGLIEQLFTGLSVVSEEEARYAQEKELVQKIFTKSAEEFAAEIIEFGKNEKLINNKTFSLPHDIEELFWISKGLTTNIRLSNENRLIKQKAWLLARSIYERERSEASSAEVKENIPNKIIEINESNEDLVSQLQIFLRKSGLPQGSDGLVYEHEMIELFWKTKGIKNFYDLPVNLSIKIKQVEIMLKEKMLFEIEGPILALSNEQLSQEMVAFTHKRNAEQGQTEWVHSYVHDYEFWQEKGIKHYGNSPQMEKKKEQIKNLAQQILINEIESNKNKREEKEMQELPNLIKLCVAWARKNGRNQVTHKDIDYFLFYKKIEILPSIKQALYIGANNEIKIKP
jgi:hypothetical protein